MNSSKLRELNWNAKSVISKFFKKYTSNQTDKKANKDPSISNVTVILTVWKRNHIEEQINCLLRQSVKPDHIWIYQCGNYVNCKKILKKFANVELIHSSVNLKYYGRFLLGRFVKTDFLFIVDDDVIPSSNWIELCKNYCSEKNAIISGAGRLIPSGIYNPENREYVLNFFFGDNDINLPNNFCLHDTIVDFGCSSWFLKTEWLDAFWHIPPYSLDTAEDMHLSATCLLKLGIKTIVIKQIDEGTCGNLRKAYGYDEFASWMKEGFGESRKHILTYLIDKQGWKPTLW